MSFIKFSYVSVLYFLESSSYVMWVSVKEVKSVAILTNFYFRLVRERSGLNRTSIPVISYFYINYIYTLIIYSI